MDPPLHHAELVFDCFRRRKSRTYLQLTTKDIFTVDVNETITDVSFMFAVLKPAEISNVHLGFLSNKTAAKGWVSFVRNIARKNNLTLTEPPKTGKVEVKIQRMHVLFVVVVVVIVLLVVVLLSVVCLRYIKLFLNFSRNLAFLTFRCQATEELNLMKTECITCKRHLVLRIV